ncbi:hypothetical protein Tco_1414566 [Tanacetum coccineum]
MDTSSRTRNNNQTGQIVDQRAVTVVGEKLSAKRVKEYEYHKETMMLYKEAKGIPLSAKQSEWLQDIDDEPNEQELEAHYMYIARIHEDTHEELDKQELEAYYMYMTKSQEVDSNVTPDSSKMSTNELGVDQNNEEPENERVLLASLIANLKLDVD